MRITVLFIMMVFLVPAQIAFSQDSADEPETYTCPNQNSLKLILGLSRDPDASGLRKNIFTIHVDYRLSTDCPLDTPYTIRYFLDGVNVTEFPNQRLPFAFARNLRGQLPGRHEVRVELQDPVTKEIITHENITVFVSSLVE